MEKKLHTPLSVIRDAKGWVIRENDFGPLCKMLYLIGGGTEGKAKAIVKACNLHEELVEVLTEVRRLIDLNGYDLEKKINSLLNKAKAE